jgi:hypothetical protein
MSEQSKALRDLKEVAEGYRAIDQHLDSQSGEIPEFVTIFFYNLYKLN